MGNDAYRYMDWLLTVPLLLIEILLVMKLSDADYSSKAWNLGVGSALMIVSGYYGELTVTGDLTPRWICWFVSMIFFLYIVFELLVGLSAATNSESDPVIKEKIVLAQVMTVIRSPMQSRAKRAGESWRVLHDFRCSSFVTIFEEVFEVVQRGHDDQLW